MTDPVKEVFVDTSAWLALEDASDPANASTTRESHRLLQEGFLHVTTNYVLDEVYTILKLRVGHSAAVRFGEKVRTSSLVSVVVVSPSMEDDAWRLFERDVASTASFTDFVSWIVMKRRRITMALTSDDGYVRMGFEAFPKKGQAAAVEGEAHAGR